MSLQVWLPLNGDLRNQGLLDLDYTIITSLTYTNDGKIGKALSGGAIKMSADNTASVLNNQEFSFACWIYVNSEAGSTTNRAMLFGNEGMTAPNNRKFSIFQYPSCNDLHISWQNNENTISVSKVWSDCFPSYKWTHLAVTYKNPNITIYINGGKKAELTYVSNSSSFSNETRLFAHSPNNCRYLNDYRVYNHCISPREVKEISKGLILHMPLASPGGENMIDNSMPTSLTGWGRAGTGWSNSLVDCTDNATGKAVRSTYSGSGNTMGGMYHHIYGASKDSYENGAVYTLTVRVRASKDCNVNIKNELSGVNKDLGF